MISLPGTEHISAPVLEPQTRARSPPPGISVSQLSPTPPCQTLQRRSDAEPPARTEDVVEARPDQNVVSEVQSDMAKEKTQEQWGPREHTECTGEVAEEEQREETNIAVEQADVEMEEEQLMERDIEDGVLLSEKERQNEELNEKDNCSASSVSSTSSTLEREEREEKFTSDTEAGT